MTNPDDLYGLPLDRFTQERNALAKAARQSGDREEADRIMALRKPSLAAWAVNQLVRTQRSDFAALLESGDQLQDAQSKLMRRSAEPGALRKALERERAAVDKLVQSARGLLSSDGHELTPQMLERVAATLHAAALDDKARDQVKFGCLERELSHVGLGPDGPPAPVKRPPRARTPARPADHPHTQEARKAASQARQAAADAERALQAALELRDRAAQALDDAESRLAAARQTARQAQRALRQTERKLGGS